MKPRSSVKALVLVVAASLAACSSSTQEPRETTPVHRHEQARAEVDPARRIADAAEADDPSRTDVRAHVVAREGGRAIVEVSWNERAPNTVEALDDATLHVVRRFSVRGEEIAAVPPKAWVVTDTLIACVDGRSDLLSGESEDDDGDCVVVPRSAHVEPTGETIEVPVPGPIPVGTAYRVRLPGDARAYWTVPAAACFHTVDFDDGTAGHAIGTCSAIGDEEPTLFAD